jgi:hypothetical protein
MRKQPAKPHNEIKNSVGRQKSASIEKIGKTANKAVRKTMRESSEEMREVKQQAG